MAQGLSRLTQFPAELTSLRLCSLFSLVAVCRAGSHSQQLEATLDPVFGPLLVILLHLGSQQNISDASAPFKGLT